MAKGREDGWSKAGRVYECLLSGKATCKRKVKGHLEEDGLYEEKSGLWRGRRKAYPLTSLWPLVNPTSLNYWWTLLHGTHSTRSIHPSPCPAFHTYKSPCLPGQAPPGASSHPRKNKTQLDSHLQHKP